METSRPLATESFSYSWLTNKRPPLDCLDESFNKGNPKETNFDFDISISNSSSTLVHADEIFSNGHIMPIYVNPSKREAFNTATSVSSIPISSLSSRTVCGADGRYCYFLRKWKKSSKRILQKWFGLGCSRKNIRVDDIDRKVWEVQSCSMDDFSDINQISDQIDVYRRLRKVKSWSNSPQESPLQSPPCSKDVLCDIESSIYEAVLHCKRSIEK